jgi:hypothetical protein
MFKDYNGNNILPLLKKNFPEIAHGTMPRHGGVSKGPFAGNNIGFGVGDDENCVRANRERIKKKFGFTHLVSARQVHGDSVYHVRSPVADCEILECDALVTALPDVGLLIGHADCQAILIYDAVHGVIAAVHNGWRGSVANIIAKTVASMQSEYGSNPADLEIGVSPSLGPCCSEFVNYRDELPRSFWKYLVKDNHFNFWKITNRQLLQCGVQSDSITIAGICTSCSVEYFSYRRAVRLYNGITGRNGSVIAMVKGSER